MRCRLRILSVDIHNSFHAEVSIAVDFAGWGGAEPTGTTIPIMATANPCPGV
jgi:hypothetical protein